MIILEISNGFKDCFDFVFNRDTGEIRVWGKVSGALLWGRMKDFLLIIFSAALLCRYIKRDMGPKSGCLWRPNILKIGQNSLR
jgi:hypothetical protein